jgi:hypothetical protein
MRLSGGRSWWAHFEFIPMNITPTILRKKIEEQLALLASFAFSNAASSPEVATELVAVSGNRVFPRDLRHNRRLTVFAVAVNC